MTTRLDYLRRQRWFAYASADTTIEVVRVLPWSRPPDAFGPGVRFELVTVISGGIRTTYNVPASYRSEPFSGLDNALMEFDGDFYVYDAMLDAHARSAILAGFLDPNAEAGPVRYELTGDLDLDASTATVPLIAEQSNTSIIVGNRYLLKLFRRVDAGRNPDIEIGVALSTTGAEFTAPIRGWATVDDVDLVMIYDYYASATDGWDSARASFRDLAAEPEVDPTDAGADFAPESARLGQVVARVHQAMSVMGTAIWAPQDMEQLVARFIARFDETTATAPWLLSWRAAALDAYAGVAALDEPIAIQRVHGDLHLGQTLRTVGGWRLIDFEGEPAKSLSDRRRFDSPLRDVAGMVRSLDYAPHSVLLQTASDSAPARLAAIAWARRNQEAFLDGYGLAAEHTSYVLLRAYQIDKAVYEVGYETTHRPAWTQIPRDALGRLLT